MSCCKGLHWQISLKYAIRPHLFCRNILGRYRIRDIALRRGICVDSDLESDAAREEAWITWPAPCSRSPVHTRHKVALIRYPKTIFGRPGASTPDYWPNIAKTIFSSAADGWCPVVGWAPARRQPTAGRLPADDSLNRADCACAAEQEAAGHPGCWIYKVSRLKKWYF